MTPAGFIADTQKTAAVLILAAATLYLSQFVARGWVPLDEGMTGQAAERVLRGEVPHVDYEEPYPGALSRLYALVFRVWGVDLVNLRWVVFAAALLATAFMYVILRRFLTPVNAALATTIAVGWSFPNYFSSLPSWWLLLCALVTLWAVMRHIETGRVGFVVVAGLAAGAAACLKQTGLFLLPPLVMSLAMGTAGQDLNRRPRWQEGTLRSAIAISAIVGVLFITRSGLGSGEVVYLIMPIAASCAAWALSRTDTTFTLRAPLIAVAASSVPIAALLLPYLTSGRLGQFLNGVFVLPQKRLEFATLAMPPATQLAAAAVALLWILWSPRSLKRTELRIVDSLRWVLALVLVAASLRSRLAYTFVWEAVRGTAALLPVIAFWLLITDRVQDAPQRRVVFATTSTLAWASLSQFPFAAPIYFCYVAPLALIAGVTTIQAGPWTHRRSDRPALAVALLFAILCLNRGYVWNVGSFPEPHDLSYPLDLPRAHLSVDAYEASVYRRLVPLVEQHLGVRGLIAGPDAPEVYFLTGQFNRSGRLFDFFTDDGANADAFDRWRDADVIVLYHGERFSPPLTETLIAALRTEFPQGESVPPFEVRWR